MASPGWILALLFTVAFTMATYLQPWRDAWDQRHDESSGIAAFLMGDARSLVAGQFFIEADVYFHRGYYPSIFDTKPLHGGRYAVSDKADVHKPAKASVGKGRSQPEDHGYLGPPLDWLDRFSRHFYPTVHTHLDEVGGLAEMLPWLQLSADLDPHRIETYTVAAYWLRTRLGQVNQAEKFLRQGLRNNPNSYAILFELGELYQTNRHLPKHARNLYLMALKKWHQSNDRAKKPDLFHYQEILARLSQINEQLKDRADALHYLRLWKKVAAKPALIQKQIQALEQQTNLAPSPAP